MRLVLLAAALALATQATLASSTTASSAADAGSSASGSVSDSFKGSSNSSSGGERRAEGRYRVTDASIAPVPPEPVDFWVGGSVEPSIDRAARVGDGWLAGPELTPELADRPFIIFIARSRWCKTGILPNLYHCGFQIVEIMPDDKEIFQNIVRKYPSG